MGLPALRSAVRLAPKRPAEDPAALALLEYQWPSSAILNAPVPAMARGVTWIVTSLVVAMIALMGFIPVDQVVSARGIVVPLSPTIVVQPLETSIVRTIEVREGQKVKAGDLLARLDPTFAAADESTLRAQQASLQAEVARLEAEMDSRPFITSGSDPDSALQARIYGHRKAELSSRVEAFRSKMEELNAAWLRSLSDAKAYQERLDVASEVEAMRRTLEAKQVGTRLNTLAAVDIRTEVARALANAEKTAEGARRELDAVDAESKAFVQSWWAEASQRLSDARRKLSDVREQLSKAKLRTDLVELRAERDGIVQSLSKISVGSVMQSGQPLMTVVPSDSGFEVEANIPGRENGFVHLGDNVSIKFETFPYTQFGMAEGVVAVVSPDAFTAQTEARNPTGALPMQSLEPYYRVRIRIDRIDMHDVPGGFRLAPGMPVTADIRIGERTVLSYLLGKVVPVAKEGMREP